MALSYKPVNRDQDYLLPVSMREWLPDDDPVWFIIEAVDRMNTTGFHTRAGLGGVGRQGFDPDMLVTLFVYAMAHGASSSRRIERLCRVDVAFRIICAGQIPDHTVLARFRQRHTGPLADLLTESLVLAARLGMVSLGVVALDGTKISANASLGANRTEDTLRRMATEWVAQTQATDEAEDAADDGSGSAGWPAQTPGRACEVTQTWQACQKALADQKTAAQQASADTQKTGDEQKTAGGGSGPAQASRGPPQVFRANTTDPDSRLLSTRNGWCQGNLGTVVWGNRSALVVDGIVSLTCTNAAGVVGCRRSRRVVLPHFCHI